MIKNAFLQQNSFDPIDKYCGPDKQIRLLKIILGIYRKGRDLVQAGIPVKEIAALEAVSEVVRLKSDVPNNQPGLIDEFGERLAQGFESLKASLTEV